MSKKEQPSAGKLTVTPNDIVVIKVPVDYDTEQRKEVGKAIRTTLEKVDREMVPIIVISSSIEVFTLDEDERTRLLVYIMGDKAVKG